MHLLIQAKPGLIHGKIWYDLQFIIREDSNRFCHAKCGPVKLIQLIHFYM